MKASGGYSGQFPCRLRDLMEETCTTQKVLADYVGVKRQTISIYMNGEGEPPISNAQNIAEYFGVSLDYLVGKDKCKTPDNEQIHKETGLTEGAIEKLKEYKGTRNLPATALPLRTSIVSALLETDAGINLLCEVFIYVYLDFGRAFNGDVAEENPGSFDEVGMKKVQFNLGNAFQYRRRFGLDSSYLGDAFLLKIPQMLKDFRKAVRAGQYGVIGSEVVGDVNPENPE